MTKPSKKGKSRPRLKQPRSRPTYFADASLSDPSRDELNRLPFAIQVAKTISSRTDAQSLIVGIYGEWGAGKTTLLNFIQAEMEKHDHIICVPFNPWRFVDEISLIKSFFATLANELNRRLTSHRRMIGETLSKLAKVIPTVSGYGMNLDVGKSVDEIGKMLAETDLEEEKSRIEELLQQEMKRVVILIDDIDRMDKSEIQALFKLIKLSADFSYVTYLLSLDDQLVASALSEKYGAKGAMAGKRFLEKIVQVPLQMPAADPLALLNFTTNLVETVLEDQRISLDHQSFLTFAGHFSGSLGRVIRTPRLAKQYANALAFSLPLLNEEVHTIDLLLIEGIRIAYPSLYKEVRKNKHIFLGTSLDEGTSPEELKERANTILSDCLRDSTGEEQRGARDIITSLFPRLKGVFQGLTVIEKNEEHLAKDKRVASEEYFDRYFAYSVPAHDVQDREVRAIIADPYASSGAIIKELLKGERCEAFLMKLSRHSMTTTSETASQLAVALAKNCDALENSGRRRLLRLSKRASAAIIITHLLSRIAKGDVTTVTQQIIEDAQPLTLALDCLLLCIKPDVGESSITFDEEEKLRLRKCLIERIRVSNEETPIYESFGDDSKELYLFWAANKHIVQDITNETFTRVLVKDSAAAIAIIRCFMTDTFESRTGDRKLFSFQHFELLCSVLSPEIVVDHLKTAYSVAAHSEPIEDDKRFHPESDEEIVSLYCALWEKVRRTVAAVGRA